jgi:hypothetical protein
MIESEGYISGGEHPPATFVTVLIRPLLIYCKGLILAACCDGVVLDAKSICDCGPREADESSSRQLSSVSLCSYIARIITTSTKIINHHNGSKTQSLIYIT